MNIYILFFISPHVLCLLHYLIGLLQKDITHYILQVIAYNLKRLDYESQMPLIATPHLAYGKPNSTHSLFFFFLS